MRLPAFVNEYKLILRPLLYVDTQCQAAAYRIAPCHIHTYIRRVSASEHINFALIVKLVYAFFDNPAAFIKLSFYPFCLKDVSQSALVKSEVDDNFFGCNKIMYFLL